MPIYQYQCTECNHALEALQKMSDPKLVDCPACNAPALKKQVTAAAFKLKGTGWYETDFKNSGNKPAEPPKADKTADSKSETSSVKTTQSETSSTTRSNTTTESAQ